MDKLCGIKLAKLGRKAKIYIDLSIDLYINIRYAFLMQSEYISISLRRQVLEKFNFRCAYCGSTAKGEFHGLSVDHFIPKSAGKIDNHVNNLVPSCHRCNTIKHKRMFTSFQDALLYVYNYRKKKNLPWLLPDPWSLESLTAESKARLMMLELAERVKPVKEKVSRRKWNARVVKTKQQKGENDNGNKEAGFTQVRFT